MTSRAPNCSVSVSNRLTLFFARVISYTLKMEATSSSEKSVYNEPTRRHIPEDSLLHYGVYLVKTWRFSTVITRALHTMEGSVMSSCGTRGACRGNVRCSRTWGSAHVSLPLPHFTAIPRYPALSVTQLTFCLPLMSPVRFTRFNTARTLLCAVLFNVMWEGLFFLCHAWI
jgi:hypothetical protein